MANGFKHATQGSVLTQTEYEAEDTHVLDSQATGDIIYASSSSVLRRLAVGAENTTLQVSSGNIPEWVAAPTLGSGTTVGNITLANGSITDSSGAISFGDENLSTTGALSIASMGGNWTNASRTVADMGIVTTIDINGGTIDAAVIGGASAAAITGTTVTGTSLVGGTVAGTTAAFSGLISANGGITFADGDDITFTGATGTNDIVLGNGLADALSITDGSADVLTISTAGGTNTVAITGDLTVSGTIAADTATTASVATTVTITDNESTDEANAIIFTSGGDLDGGNIGLESDGTLNYNPYTGTLTTTTFAGALTGNADTATALATGRTIAMTGDVAWTSASFTGAGNVTGAGTIQANAVEGSMLNTNVISGQTEITSGLAAADELLYDDGGVLKKVGLDTLTSYLAGVNAGTVTSTGISDSSGVLTVDIQNMTASTTIADADLVVVDDGANGTLRKMTRANFIESAALDAINIDGGAIDGAVIGANDAAAGTFAALVSTTFAPTDDITLAADKSLNLPQGANIDFTDVIADNGIDDHDAQGVIFTFNAGATVTPFSPVYLAEDNLVEEANASAIATMPCIGVSINTSDVTVGNPIKVLVMGLIRDDDFNFGTHGAAVYVSTTVGTMTSTAPSSTNNVVQVIGHSIEDDAIFVQPCLTTIEHA